MKHIEKSLLAPMGAIMVLATIGAVALFYQNQQGQRSMVTVRSAVVTSTPTGVPQPEEDTLSATTTISILPEHIIQGDPVMVTIEGTTTPTKVLFDGTLVHTFIFNNKQTAFIPIDLNQNPATYLLMVTFADGTLVKKQIVVYAREKIEAPLGIPAKLGGNTPASEKTLVDTLAKENASLLHLKTGEITLWTSDFQYPIANPVVTDDYGYTRDTGNYTISHKGTDFRADEGTPVLAMNDGVVRLAKTYVEYGNTIVVDHGLGVMTFYMHLSKIQVKVGQQVTKGQVIGLSGQTGYADQPHLHLTVRINDISIDPMVFLGFFH